MARERALLAAGLSALGIPWRDESAEGALKFVRLLEKWNKTYNLTAIRHAEKMVGLHLLDSLAVLPYLHGERIIDIGTGAGLPGIPLALFAPERRFWLLDSNAKKTRFVQQAVLELGLTPVEVICARVEDFQGSRGFDTVITRAFASLEEIVAGSGHLLGPGGMILAMKGRYPESELLNLTGFEATVIPLEVPQVDADRHLVRLVPRRPSPQRHMTNNGEILNHG